MENNIRKNFILNTFGSTLYSITSLFFMIIVTRINGLDESGIFTFAFSAACLFWVIGVYSGRIYQVTERNKKITDSDYIYTKIITCIAMVLISILYLILKGYNAYKFTVILLLIIYKTVNAFAEVIYAIMQKKEELYKVGISLLIKAVLETILFLIIDIITKNLIYSSISLIMSETIILIFYDLKVLKSYNFKLSKFKTKNSITILKYGLPVFVFTILTQYIINASKYAIDNNLTDKAQSIYGMLSMVATLTVMLSQLILHPYINSMNEDLKNNNTNIFNKKVIKICLLIIALGIIECLLGYLFGTWFLGGIYNVDLHKYNMLLLIIVIGSALYSLVSILSNALIAMRENISQSVVFIFVSIILYFLSNYIVKKYGIIGAGYAYLSAMTMLLVMFIILYITKLKKLDGDKNES